MNDGKRKFREHFWSKKCGCQCNQETENMRYKKGIINISCSGTFFKIIKKIYCSWIDDKINFRQ